MSPILTEPQAKVAIGVAPDKALSAGDDQWLTGARNALGPVLEQEIAPIERRTVTLTIRGGRGSLVFPWPVESVTTLTGATLTTWTAHPELYRFGIVRRLDETWWPDELITAAVVVGYFVPGADPDVDDPVVPLKPSTFFAACELLRFWWQQGRQGPGGFAAQSGGFTVPQGFLIPERVKSLLNSPDAAPALPGIA